MCKFCNTAFCPKNEPRSHPHSLFQCVIPRCFVTQQFINVVHVLGLFYWLVYTTRIFGNRSHFRRQEMKTDRILWTHRSGYHSFLFRLGDGNRIFCLFN
jgi:hypothetical protein